MRRFVALMRRLEPHRHRRRLSRQQVLSTTIETTIGPGIINVEATAVQFGDIGVQCPLISLDRFVLDPEQARQLAGLLPERSQHVRPVRAYPYPLND